MNKTALNLGLCLALAAPSAFGSTIAIIDSGTDHQHKDLAAQYVVNAKEIPGNKKDDDQNGYKDDVNGYNITEPKADVIDYSYLEKLKPFMPDIHKLFEIQARMLDQTASDEDKAWVKFMKGQPGFMKNLQIFGNFAHGTHVAGITAGHSTSVEPDNKVFAIKLIPTEVKLPFSVQFMKENVGFKALLGGSKIEVPPSIKLMGLETALRALAKMQTKVFADAGKYVNARGADVANGSFGTGYKQIKMIVETLYNAVFKYEERKANDVEELTRVFMQQVLIHSRQLPLSAPKTLFVFAAGNDGSDNDVMPCSPANLREDNTITVAATLRNRELASFSNYGARKVDVAAPGVGIKSLYPGNDYGLMSGTSQAAPYVAMVAGVVKNQNPSLTPAQVKEILMGTVDLKEWLANKVKTSGLVNPDRAREAGLLSKSMPVGEAILASRRRVKDLAVDEKSMPTDQDGIGFAVQPLVSPIH